MIEWLISDSLSLSFITLISLLVNAVTIYKWVSDNKDKSIMNNQAYEMVRGLALANSKRANMIVTRINALKEQSKDHEEAMIFLENTYSDAQSNIEALLATAKALKPEKTKELPYDSQSLLGESMVESDKHRLQQEELAVKIQNVRNSNNQQNT